MSRSAGDGPNKSTLVFAGQSVIGPRMNHTNEEVSMEVIGSMESSTSPESTFKRGSELHLELSHGKDLIASV